MPSQYLKLWYSFDVGPIHNLVFSTELDYSRGSEQFSFILTVGALQHTPSTMSTVYMKIMPRLQLLVLGSSYVTLDAQQRNQQKTCCHDHSDVLDSAA